MTAARGITGGTIYQRVRLIKITLSWLSSLNLTRYHRCLDFLRALETPNQYHQLFTNYDQVAVFPLVWAQTWERYPNSNVHGANMGPIWVLSAPDGPHVGPTNIAIRVPKTMGITWWHIQPADGRCPRPWRHQLRPGWTLICKNAFWRPSITMAIFPEAFYSNSLTLIPARITNYIQNKVCDEIITHPLTSMVRLLKFENRQ